MSIQDFTILDILGKGSFASVYTAKRKSDGQIYALKKVNLSSLKDKEKTAALREVQLLASLSHPNLVAYKESFIENNHLYLVMEYCPRGDLQNQLS